MPVRLCPCRCLSLCKSKISERRDKNNNKPTPTHCIRFNSEFINNNENCESVRTQLGSTQTRPFVLSSILLIAFVCVCGRAFIFCYCCCCCCAFFVRFCFGSVTLRSGVFCCRSLSSCILHAQWFFFFVAERNWWENLWKSCSNLGEVIANRDSLFLLVSSMALKALWAPKRPVSVPE